MTTSPLKFYNFSFTRAKADEECQRQRYLSREWGGTGLMSVRDSWALLHGNIVHKALEDHVKLGTVDYPALRKHTYTEAIASGFDHIKAMDWAAIVEGQVYGFVRSVWPTITAEYNIIEAEKWIELDLPFNGRQYKFRARQDLLLQNKFDGHYCYVDYKNSSNPKPKWLASWAKSVQLHSSMYAINQSTNIHVERALVIGLNKGYEDEKLHTQRSIFSYGWVNREYSMTPTYNYEYQRGRGWELFPVAAEFESARQWVDHMPTEVLSAQYVRTAPIFYREDIAKEWFTQQLMREERVAEADEALQKAMTIEDIDQILRKHYKQHFSKCQPAWGYDCEFAALCWTPWIQADPVGSGQYKRYQSDLEVE